MRLLQSMRSALYRRRSLQGGIGNRVDGMRRLRAAGRHTLVSPAPHTTHNSMQVNGVTTRQCASHAKVASNAQAHIMSKARQGLNGTFVKRSMSSTLLGGDHLAAPWGNGIKARVEERQDLQLHHYSNCA